MVVMECNEMQLANGDVAHRYCFICKTGSLLGVA